MALLPKLKTKDKAKSVSFFGKGTNQNCALLPAPSFLHSASPLFTLALAQIIRKNLSYFPRIVERDRPKFDRNMAGFVTSKMVSCIQQLFSTILSEDNKSSLALRVMYLFPLFSSVHHP